MVVMLPIGANIPSHWFKAASVEKAIIPMPSRTQEGLVYDVELDWATRELKCPCEGYKFRRECGHVKALVFASYKKKSKRKGMADTQLASYYKFTIEHLSTRRKAVYECLETYGPLSNRLIAEKEHKPVNCITGRTNELCKMGLADEVGTVYDPVTDRHVILWGLVS